MSMITLSRTAITSPSPAEALKIMQERLLMKPGTSWDRGASGR